MSTRSGEIRSSSNAVVEALEERRHLSAGGVGAGAGFGSSEGSATLAMGALVVTGTRHADMIRLSMHAGDSAGGPAKLDVTVNDRLLGSFDLAAVPNGVHVLAWRGDDMVFVDDSAGFVPVGVNVYGGAGNDTLVGGAMDDALFGEHGDDVLFGNDGNDLLDGGHGNDLIAGGFGDDTLFGGHDDDALFGEIGNDALYGGHGADTLDGGDEDDLLDGGGDHNNVIAGGPGADRFAAHDTAHEIVDLAAGDTHGG
jgi:Ca2+-binding RTX toxin-like protein